MKPVCLISTLAGSALFASIITPAFATDYNTLCPALKWDLQYGRDCGYRVTTLRYKPVKFAQAYTDSNFNVGTRLLAVGHMNDRFTVVGQAYHRDGKRHAVAVQINELYSENHYYTDLGLANLTSNAGGVDNYETIAGTAQLVSGGASKPVLFRGNGSNYSPIAVTLLGGSSGMLTDVKSGLHLYYGYPMEYRVGWEILADGRKHGVAVWLDGGVPVTAKQIGSASATSQALATNASGHAVGVIRDSSDPADRAFIWNWDSFSESATLTKLASLGGATVALDANNNRSPKVVGYSIDNATNYRFATSWTETTLSTLPNLSGSGNPNAQAYSVTDAGDIVGTSRSKATIWRDSQVYDLNTKLTVSPGTALTRAVQINRQGIIVAYGADGNFYFLVPAEHL